MAQGPLIRAAAAAGILALGAAAEALAPAATPLLTAADFAVGASLGCASAWLLVRAPLAAWLGLLTASAWFAGALAPVLLLAYRGPLLHLLLVVPGRSRHTSMIAAAAWITALLPVAAGPATAACAALVAGSVAARTRRAAAGQRPALAATAIAAAALSGVWWLAALDLSSRTTLAALNDVAVLAAGAIALSACAGFWARGAAGSLVIELGAGRGPGRPLTAQLARALADPTLELRYAIPGAGWVDERGRPVPAPETEPATRAVVPGGGEVALVHSGAIDSRLAEAAAAAAALALDSARLETAVRASAAEVRASRRRLLTAADAERRALEARLSEGPLAALRAVDRRLRASPLRAELQAAIAELSELSRGLYPPTLAHAELAAALDEMVRRSPVPATVTISGDPHTLTDELRATAWFVCSEALANVVRHARASHASVSVRIDAAALTVEIADDGRGGAVPRRGLRSLADRVESSAGTLRVDSPAGGPTTIRVRLPRT